MPEDTDEQLFHILKKLDCRHDEGRIDLYPKDEKFISDNIYRWEKEGHFKFSPPQRRWISDLEDKHLG